jgi:hypothetical protein
MARMTSETRATPDDLDAIIGLDEPVIRNLLITERYHDLSLGLRDVVDTGNVNWSTFATWASKTAGETIRDEEIPSAIRELLSGAERVLKAFDVINEGLRLLPGLGDANLSFEVLLAPIDKTIRDLSADISAGNLKVFRELAPVFRSYIVTFGGDASPDRDKLAGWVAKLRPGLPDDDDGQSLLREAFTGYYEARFETDEDARARRILTSNAQIGLHEQTRLQPQIEAALNAPIEDVLREEVHAAARDIVPLGHHGRIAEIVTKPLDGVIDEAGALFRRLATRTVMNLSLPLGERMPLGKDIAPEPGEPVFPPALQRISGPPGLLALMERYDRASRANAADTGATDWSSLDDRMNFILNLFRSRQQDLELFDQPFEPEQRAEIEARKRPSGPL